MVEQSLTSAEAFAGLVKKATLNPNKVRVRFRQIPALKETQYIRVGYLPESTGVPEAYITTVTSKALQCKVCAVVQEKIQFLVNGVWEPFPGLGMFNEVAELIPQALLGVTLVQPWMKRRMWRGSTPISISVDMNFYAYDDAYNNVLLPCMLLQQMALPQETLSVGVVENEGTASETYGKLFSVYSPPGPSPFTVFEDTLAGGDKIDLTFGNILRFSNVIVSECLINLENKLTEQGYPITGSARIVFETFEMMTKESLRAVYQWQANTVNFGSMQSLTLQQAKQKFSGTVVDKIADVVSGAGG
jgi:hypothetical protein